MFPTLTRLHKSTQNSLNDLKRYLENSRKGVQVSNDEFIGIMSDFALKCEDKLSMLVDKKNQMAKSYQAVVDCFSIDVEHYLMHTFFCDVKNFKDKFEQICKENAKIPRLETPLVMNESKNHHGTRKNSI